MHGFSLIIATKGRTEELNSILNSITIQDYKGKIQLIIVDQNQDDRLNDIISNYQSMRLEIDHIRTNITGLSNARNLGIKFIKYNIIGFPDDDCWYERDTLTKVFENFNDTLSVLIAKWVENDFCYPLNESILNVNEIKKFKTVPLSSICIFMSANIIHLVNGFDSSLGLGTYFSCGEDLDIVIRSCNYGKVAFNPLIKVHHRFTKKRTKSIKSIISREKGTGALYIKHKIDHLIIFRGLISPIMYSIKNFSILPVFTIVGRIKGMVNWKLKNFQQ